MKRPTRRDLLLVIGELYEIVDAMGEMTERTYGQDRAGPLRQLEERARKLCSGALSVDPPLTRNLSSNGLADPATLGQDDASVRRRR